MAKRQITFYIGANSEGFQEAIRKAERTLSDFSDKAIDTGEMLSTRLTLPLVAAGAMLVKSFSEDEEAIARMTAALRANGGQANITSKEIIALADNLERTTTFAGDATTSAAGLLLTFHRVRNEMGKGNDVFNRTIIAAQDLAAALGMDLQSATMQLAKAMENPTIGLTALTRSGTTFTQQQKDQIKALMESNRQLDAQKMILDEVERQYKGTAEAMRGTLAGTIAGSINEMGVEMDKFGAIIAEALIPMIDTTLALVKQLSQLDDGTRRFIITLGAFAAGAGPVIYVIGQLTAGIRAMMLSMVANPYVALAVGLTALGIAAYNAMKSTDGLNERLREALKLGDELKGTQQEYNRLVAEQQRLSAELARIEQTRARGGLSAGQLQALAATEASIKTQMAAVRELAREWSDLNKVTAPAASAPAPAAPAAVGTTAYELRSANTALTMLNESFADSSLSEWQQKMLELGFQIPQVATAWVDWADMVAYSNEQLALVGGQMQMTTSDVAQMSLQMSVAQDFAQSFTNSFGQGMANVIVQGERLTDTLRNIGRLLVSSAIQTGIRLLLMGPSAFGVKGGGTGLLGGLLGFNVAPTAPAVIGAATMGGSAAAANVVQVVVSGQIVASPQTMRVLINDANRTNTRLS